MEALSSAALLALAVLVYAALHSLLASLGLKGWARRRFGLLAERWYRLAYNLFAGISALPMLVLFFVLPDRMLYQVPFPWLLLPVAGQLAGVAIIVAGLLQADPWGFVGLRQIMSARPAVAQPLTVGGLHGWVRHPLYTGAFLVLWLTPLMTGNLLVIFILSSLYLVVGAGLEERRLLHEFGDGYREYQRRVPMLVPRPPGKRP